MVIWWIVAFLPSVCECDIYACIVCVLKYDTSEWIMLMDQTPLRVT